MSCSKEKDVAVISTQFGDMVVEFYPEIAPKHVESFTILAKEEYFDGTTFHRVIPGFVIQGGDPNSKDTNRLNDGVGGRAGKFFGIGRENDPETWMIPSEFNDKLHVKGTLSMARGQDPARRGRAGTLTQAGAQTGAQTGGQAEPFVECLDYIWISEALTVVGCPKLPATKEEVSGPFPNGHEPSDHLPLRATLRFSPASASKL